MTTQATATSGLCDITRLYAEQTAMQASQPSASPRFALAQLATVFSGYAVHSTQHCEDGNTVLIQEKDLAKGMAMPLARCRLGHMPARQVLQPGDIVLKLRGKTKPAMVLHTVEPCTVCVASLAVVRILDVGRVLPGYLAWWLNGPEAQTALTQYARQGRVPMVRVTALRGLEVMLPSMGWQQKIARIHALNQQIGALEQVLLQKKQRYADEALRVLTEQMT